MTGIKMSNIINFTDLVKRHGEIEAMTQLEALETVAAFHGRLAALQHTPDQRLVDALKMICSFSLPDKRTGHS